MKESNAEPSSPRLHPDTISRRAFVVAVAEKIGVPLMVGGVGAWIGVILNQRYQQRHSLAITVIRSGRAAPKQGGDPLMENLLLDGMATPAPDPNPEYVYTAVLRNSGDYAEIDVNVEITFQRAGTGSPGPLSAEVIASSLLLRRTIRTVSPLSPQPSFAFVIPRLNPDEWLSLRTAWPAATDLHVQVRSTSVFGSYHS